MLGKSFGRRRPGGRRIAGSSRRSPAASAQAHRSRLLARDARGPERLLIAPGAVAPAQPGGDQRGPVGQGHQRAAAFDGSGGVVHRLTSPKHKVPKIYRATLDADLAPRLIAEFASGTLLLDGEKTPCAPAELKIISLREAELALTEGRYHQVRRMFAAAGMTVLTLHRVRSISSWVTCRRENFASSRWIISAHAKPRRREADNYALGVFAAS